MKHEYDAFLKSKDTGTSLVPCPSLEVGTMLTLIFVACKELGLPIFERDLLDAARDNSIKYLTAYRHY